MAAIFVPGAEAMEFDWIIRNGRVIDGTGSPWFRADVGIQGGRIAAVGNLAGAVYHHGVAAGHHQVAAGGKEVDARGMFVCPGFVDAHSHSDSVILADPTNLPKLSQGITTEILGQDGVSYLPLSERTAALVDDLWHGINGHNPRDGQTSPLAGLFQRIDRRVTANYAFLIPHTTVRMEVMGMAQRAATPEEIEAMGRWVEQLMQEGAVGLSTGLSYWPEIFTTTEELIELCRVVAKYGGIYVTHLRSYGDNLFTAMEEAITIAEQSGIPAHISHLSIDDARVVEVIDAARSRGIDVTFDLYPYLAGTTLLMQYLPDDLYRDSVEETVDSLDSKEVRERVRTYVRGTEPKWGKLILSNTGSFHPEEIAGRTVAEAAGKLGMDLSEMICNLLVESQVSATVIGFGGRRSEEGLHRLIRHPAQMFCTDAILVGSHLHPRSHGTFPRALGRYVLEQGVIPVEEAVRKMTSFPAQRHGITDRGLIKPGMAADVVIFDPEQIHDEADYQDGSRLSRGIESVWVNGELAFAQGQPTGSRSGRILTLQGAAR